MDAVYERQTDKKIVFFIGKQIWLFDNNNRLAHGYPQTLTFIGEKPFILSPNINKNILYVKGIPDFIERIDAVMVWGHNAKTYLFSGSHYWRLEEEENKVELDYPRDISVWKGIPSHIDAAFQWSIDSNYHII